MNTSAPDPAPAAALREAARVMRADSTAPDWQIALATLLETVAYCECEEGDDHWPEKTAALKVARTYLDNNRKDHTS